MSHISPYVRMANQVLKPGREVVLGVEIDHVRLITLNNPQRSNVLTRDVVALLGLFLEKWEKDEDAELILVTGSGSAFCAGGDLKMFYNGRTTKDMCADIVYRMHWLCYHIHSYKKTLVALVDGYCFGGGASLMTPMKFSVVTEKTIFMAPEASFGFHPGWGLTHALSRLPGYLGEFLVLTGTKLNGLELVATGLATHFVSSEMLAVLQNRLISLNSGEENVVKSTIEEFSTNAQIDENSVLNKQKIIDACFSKDSVEEIISSLENEASREGNRWIFAFLKTIKRSSPTALKITLHMIREARTCTFAECVKKEFTIAINVLRNMISTDVYEGIRGLAIDKNHTPKWNPCTLESVHAENINMVFQPFEKNMELKIPMDDNSRWNGKFEDSPYNVLSATRDFSQSRL